MGVSGKTAIYGLIAHPVEHVGSPALINPYLQEHGRDAILVPLHVLPASLSAALDGLRSFQNLHGFLVTIPHKQAIVPLLDRIDPGAELAGAVNVVRRERDGTLTGGQLDGEGFVRAMRKAGGNPEGARIYLAGAGGVAVGIAFALARQGARAITVANRTQARAEGLVERIASAFPDCEARPGGASAEGHHIVINATCLGLKPSDPLPLDMASLDGSMLAADVIVNPKETEFLRSAATRGCRLQYGFSMVEEQIPLLIDFMSPPSV